MGYIRQCYYSIYCFLLMLLGAVGMLTEWIVCICKCDLSVHYVWQSLLMLAAIALYFIDYFSHRQGLKPPKQIMYILICFWVIMAALQAAE